MRLGPARAHWMIVVLLPLLAARLAAQEPEPKPLVVHTELSITHVTMPAPDSTTVNGAIGFDFAGVFEVRDRWHFVLGFQHSSHKTTDSPNNLSVLQLFVEGRYMLRVAQRVQPYVFARLGYLHTANDMELYDDTGVLVNGHAVQTGPAAGLGAGVLITVTKRLQYYAGGGAQFASLGDIDFDGFHVANSSLNGLTVFVRTGVSLNFGPDGNTMRNVSHR